MTAWTQCDDCGRQLSTDATQCACGWKTSAGQAAQEASTRCERCREPTPYLAPYLGAMTCAECFKHDLREEHYTTADQWRSQLIRDNPQWQKRPNEDSKAYALRMLAGLPNMVSKEMP